MVLGTLTSVNVNKDISANARLMAHALHVPIDYYVDEEQVTPLLMPLDNEGRPVLHIETPSQVDFYKWKIDYYNHDYHVVGTRLISMVTPGYHTYLAYSPKSMDQRVMEIHSGVGYLILGNIAQPEEDIPTTIFKLDAEVTPRITIPAGKCFTLEVPDWSEKPLVVSELFRIREGNELDNAEVVFEQGEQIIDTPDGQIEVPEEFSTGNFS